jgi:hypothetical protein
VPWAFSAIFDHFHGQAGKSYREPLQKLPGEEGRGKKESGFGRSRVLISAREIDHLSARTLNADARHAITFALHRHARFAIPWARSRTCAKAGVR